MELYACAAPASAPRDILAPAQQKAADAVLEAIQHGRVVTLEADAGRGRTTVLRHVHAQIGGAFVGTRELLRKLDLRDPFAIEESWIHLIEESLAAHNVVIVDDLHLITQVTGGCDYPRPCVFDMALTAVLEHLAPEKRLIFGIEDDAPNPVARRAHVCKIEPLASEDYRAICLAHLGARGEHLDYDEIHRYAPALSAHSLKTASEWTRNAADLSTGKFIDYLSTRNLTSNVEIEEVPPVNWKDLKGVDDVIAALDAKIALPLEDHEMAARYHLKPKRGVLLAGPPGTGKTTIGRALAHRLKSKFFLVDGTVIAGSDTFYRRLHGIFQAAKRNAPSIIFIDDADVLFEDDNKSLYRYLLTMLDGLESASAERVCVMMTAMEVSGLPPALVRSGRVELWLETRLPDETARQAILTERLSVLPEPLASADTVRLARESRKMTGADLKAAIEDAKLLFAHDCAQAKPARPVEEYVLEAIATIRKNRRNYARRKPAARLDDGTIGFRVENGC